MTRPSQRWSRRASRLLLLLGVAVAAPSCDLIGEDDREPTKPVSEEAGLLQCAGTTRGAVSVESGNGGEPTSRLAVEGVLATGRYLERDRAVLKDLPPKQDVDRIGYLVNGQTKAVFLVAKLNGGWVVAKETYCGEIIHQPPG